MKKILFVATVAGHINVFHLQYLKMFQENGYEVHVATKRVEEVKIADKKYEICFERFPIKKNNIKAYKQLKNIIYENKYDIIHCHTPVGGALARLCSIKARKNFNTRVIYTAHGFHFYKEAPKLNWLIYYPLEKWLSRYTDTLITINHEDYEMAKKHLKAKDIYLVHGVGVEEEKFDFVMKDTEKEEFRKSLGLEEKDFVITIIGELNKNKNQIKAIEVMKELTKRYKNVKLLLVGSGILEEFYTMKIREYQLQKNIILLGRRNDVPKILKITNLLLSLSLREGLPVNVMEAMYVGKPIIALDNRGNRELVENDKNGFIIPRNKDIEENLYNRICELIENEEKIDKLAKNSKQKVEQYTMSNVIKEMAKIYQI